MELHYYYVLGRVVQGTTLVLCMLVLGNCFTGYAVILGKDYMTGYCSPRAFFISM